MIILRKIDFLENLWKIDFLEKGRFPVIGLWVPVDGLSSAKKKPTSLVGLVAGGFRAQAFILNQVFNGQSAFLSTA